MVFTTANGAQTFPNTTITVTSAIGFTAPSGTIYVVTSTGTQTINYTGGNGASAGGLFTSGTTFTFTSSGTAASIATGAGVFQSVIQGTSAFFLTEKLKTPAATTGVYTTSTGVSFTQDSNSSGFGSTVFLLSEKLRTPASVLGVYTTSIGVYQTQTSSMSFDRDLTSNLNTEKLKTPAFPVGNYTINSGTYEVYSGQPGPNDRMTDISSSALDKTNIPDPLPFTGSSTTKYYKMVGYYVTGAVYEEFVVTGAPSASTAVNPNTTHTLINCYVSTFWQQ
jgi:hypothetical protein